MTKTKKSAKTVFITGATGGLGEATARCFATAGYQVAVGYHSNATKATQIVKTLEGMGHIAVQCTINDTASVQRAKGAIADHFGTLNALVNNAGFTQFVAHHDLQGLTDDLIDSILQTHIRGNFACVRELETLLTNNSCIINISSIAGQTGMGSNIAYCAAKAALDCMTKSLARALAPKTRVIAVAPGLVDTPFVQGLDVAWRNKQEHETPMKRLAEPQEVGQAILTCVDTLSFTTGRTIYVDGGRPLGTL